MPYSHPLAMTTITYSLTPLLLLALSAAAAPTNQTLPRRAPGTSNVVGSCGVSAQHMFVGTNDKVYLLDRSDSNPLKLANGDPATAAEWSLSEKQCRAMQVESNQFCAGGGVLSDGTWANVGGNPVQNGNFQTDGLRAIRHMKPCDDNSCQWAESTDLQLQVPRWYPSVETLDDGSVIIFGGYDKQVFLPFPKDGNAASAEYFPSKGKPQDVPVLDRAWPFSMYPLTSHLSDGRIFIVAGSETAIWNPADASEVQLPKMPNGPRTYPGGGASVLLPLTPDNDYEETFMACGGTILADWGDAACPPDNAYETPAHAKCDMIKPLAKNPQWTSAADLPSRRVMGNFIILPTGELMLVNGAENGVQGYVCGPGESQAINPALVPQLYNPKTNKWSEMAATTVPRGYHSSATLLPDGSVMTAGSSPHADVSTAGPFPTGECVWKRQKRAPKANAYKANAAARWLQNSVSRSSDQRMLMPSDPTISSCRPPIPLAVNLLRWSLRTKLQLRVLWFV